MTLTITLTNFFQIDYPPFWKTIVESNHKKIVLKPLMNDLFDFKNFFHIQKLPSLTEQIVKKQAPHFLIDRINLAHSLCYEPEPRGVRFLSHFQKIHEETVCFINLVANLLPNDLMIQNFETTVTNLTIPITEEQEAKRHEAGQTEVEYEIEDFFLATYDAWSVGLQMKMINIPLHELIIEPNKRSKYNKLAFLTQIQEKVQKSQFFFEIWGDVFSLNYNDMIGASVHYEKQFMQDVKNGVQKKVAQYFTAECMLQIFLSLMYDKQEDTFPETFRPFFFFCLKNFNYCGVPEDNKKILKEYLPQ